MSLPTGLNRYGESKKAPKNIQIRTSEEMAILRTVRGVNPLRYFQSIESLNRFALRLYSPIPTGSPLSPARISSQVLAILSLDFF